MTADQLSYAAGVILSLIFAYTPGLAPKYDALDAAYKRLIMLALLLIVAAGILFAGCFNVSLFGVAPVECSQASAVKLFELFISAAIANQATFLLAKNSKA